MIDPSRQPLVSIVMGTWNRLPLLKQCIEAVRKSVGSLFYEIIVVDGGSTDGSIAWMQQQPDVIAIEQGELLGACRAYNAGFRLARAPFTVHINDDDVVLDDCIARAVKHMQANPKIGQAAFAFDLWTPGTYKHDGVFGHTYANKGITRRELGDRAHWWTELFRTYAGDTELSCRILDMGYSTAGLADCKAHDLRTQDELREINNPVGKNPDSSKFYRLRKGITPAGAQKRVLHIALNSLNDHQPALERALRSIGEYRQIDWLRIRNTCGIKRIHKEVLGACNSWKPDLVFIQLQTEGILDQGILRQMKASGRTIVNWSGDVRAVMPSWYAEMGREIDLTLLTNDNWIEALRAQGVIADYLQIGFNQEIYHPWGQTAKSPPIVFLGNNYGHFPLSEQRLSMVRFLKRTYGEAFGVYGTGWPPEAKQHARLNHQNETVCYRGCKIAVGISQLELGRYTSDRLFRAMGSGAFYLTKHYPGIEQDYERGTHLDWWHDLDELKQRIDHYLKHDDERKKIARAGAQLVHNKHTWLDRIYQLRERLGYHTWR